ncbi:hypothetical protein MUK42_23236 [Musa troglodytarum]|uniref:Uncharacterized protein n=1 Tax=Musa troglodytarum TaxID=320322 RepID=A0A9E7HG01_9LILI|nr:hypothetical protein MUK42_23236 [Musa troglodytarum]
MWQKEGKSMDRPHRLHPDAFGIQGSRTDHRPCSIRLEKDNHSFLKPAFLRPKRAVVYPVADVSGWYSLNVNGEVQMRKGLRWIPRHLETRKGAKRWNESCTLDGERPPCKAKYSWREGKVKRTPIGESTSETMGDKLHHHQLRPLNDRSVIKEEVCLEAVTLERMNGAKRSAEVVGCKNASSEAPAQAGVDEVEVRMFITEGESGPKIRPKGVVSRRMVIDSRTQGDLAFSGTRRYGVEVTHAILLGKA